MPAVPQDLPALPRGPELREGRGFLPPVLPRAGSELRAVTRPWCSFLIVLSSLAEETQVQETDQARNVLEGTEESQFTKGKQSPSKETLMQRTIKIPWDLPVGRCFTDN